ncbi:MAG: amidohydrolase family protein [Lachnospira sp.]|nr:amidohydrolase family protein [Lachnospira sp.]
MIIDFHTHIFPEKIVAKTIETLEQRAGIKASTDGTLNGLIASMDKAGIDMSVVLPVVTKPSQFNTVNEYAKYVNETYGDRLISFGGIHPDSEDYKAQLDTIKSLGLPGIKLHPDYQGVMIDDPRYMNIIEYADSLGLIILTHAGVDIGLPEPVHCTPDRMRRVIDDIKPKKMVVAHFGGYDCWEQVYECLAGEDVYLDTAFTLDYIGEEMFYKILDKHDAKKILFASDSPWSDANRGVQLLKRMPLREDVINNILYGNAKRLLGFM